MPVINAVGSIIPERKMTKEEVYLSNLYWPHDYSSIRKLSSEQFRKWMYGLDPREAMILSSDLLFKFERDLKLKKWRTLWRLAWE